MDRERGPDGEECAVSDSPRVRRDLSFPPKNLSQPRRHIQYNSTASLRAIATFAILRPPRRSFTSSETLQRVQPI